MKAELDRLFAAPDGGAFMGQLFDFAARIGDDAGEALLAAYPALFDHAPALTAAYRRHIVGTEIAEFERLMREPAPRDTDFGGAAGSPGRASYDRVGDLFGGVDFTSCRRFVMVGCGRSPSTILHVHDRTSVPELVGLDVAPDAIAAVRALADRLGLARVRVDLGDGSTYDYASADIVFIANMVSPKAAVLSRVLDTAPTHIQIVVRDSYSLGRLWAEALGADIDSRLEVVGTGPGSRWLSRNLYLKRRGAPPPIRA